jgi:hypothetical protein
VGLRIRGSNNFNQNYAWVQDVYVMGTYAGILTCNAHNMLMHFGTQFCTLGKGVFDPGDNHTSTLSYAVITDCKYALAGWNPLNGAVSLAGTDNASAANLTNRFYLTGGKICIEYPTDPAWSFTAFVLDANNRMYGRVGYTFWLLGQLDSLPPTVIGGDNLDLYYASSQDSRFTRVVTASAGVAGASFQQRSEIKVNTLLPASTDFGIPEWLAIGSTGKVEIPCHLDPRRRGRGLLNLNQKREIDMAGELILNEVASSGVSTPAASKDALHQTNDTPSRLARKDSGGNIYYEQEQVIMSQIADFTLTDSAHGAKGLQRR